MLSEQLLQDARTRLDAVFERKREVQEMLEIKKGAYSELQQELDQLYTDIGHAKTAIEKSKEERSNAYEKHNAYLSETYDEIGRLGKQEELCRMLDQQFTEKVKHEQDYLADIYRLLAEHARTLRWNYRKQRDKAVSERRSMAKPSNEAVSAAYEQYNDLRAKQTTKREQLNTVKEEIEALKTEQRNITNEIGDLRAIIYDGEETDNSFLEKFIDEKYWPTAKVRRTNTSTHIYYGVIDRSLQWHGHVVIRDGEVVFRRDPKDIAQVC